MGSVSWVDVLSAVAGSIAAVLSVIAVLVTLRVARQSSQQAGAIASTQERRELQAYSAERKAEFRAQCRSVIMTANAIETIANPRISELLSSQAEETVDRASLRGLLAPLAAETSMLTAFGPATSAMPVHLAPLVRQLHEEAAWVYSDALHLAILVLEPSESAEEVDLRDEREVVDALLNGSSVNLEPRLLSGYRVRDVTADGAEDHAEWQAAYDRRERRLLSSDIVNGAPPPESLAEIAARALSWVSIRRFTDLASEILASWEDGDVVEFRRRNA